MNLPNENKLNFLVGVHVNFSQVLTGGGCNFTKYQDRCCHTGEVVQP